MRDGFNYLFLILLWPRRTHSVCERRQYQAVLLPHTAVPLMRAYHTRRSAKGQIDGRTDETTRHLFGNIYATTSHFSPSYYQQQQQ
uniref:Putative secreted peptide n=1 Tax=Anopheles braziliensis TaxID=58242 RepID=A0A2M3ZWN1_9DIPT